MPTLYLIPVPLSDTALGDVLPEKNNEIVKSIRHFVVENLRSARRFLRQVDGEFDIDASIFYELNKHTKEHEIETFLQPLADGFDMGIISEAGCPAIADPGSDIVALAQCAGYEVTPLVGPSSILLSLMASGFNGQGFTFHGYLPIETKARAARIHEMDQQVARTGYTQIFIETPYRNDKLFDDLCHLCQSKSKLCIAKNITAADSSICTRTIADWRKHKPQINKIPTIFLLGQ